jgi:hypothetical protein
MGVDACIYFKTRDGFEPPGLGTLGLGTLLPSKCPIIAAVDDFVESATHEIDQNWRYYGPGYERGPWPIIAAVLMALHASHDVETVWYFGDCFGEDGPFTPQQVLAFTAHYMATGRRKLTTLLK